MDSFAHDRIASVQKATFVDLMTGAFAGFEKLVALNLQTSKTWYAEQQVLNLEAARAPSFSVFLDLQARQLPAAWHKAVAYSRHVCKIAAETQAECATAAERGIAEYLREALTLMDHLGRTAPAGANLALAGRFLLNEGPSPLKWQSAS